MPVTSPASNERVLRASEWSFWRLLYCVVPVAVALAIQHGEWQSLLQPPMREGLALLGGAWLLGTLLARRAMERPVLAAGLLLVDLAGLALLMHAVGGAFVLLFWLFSIPVILAIRGLGPVGGLGMAVAAASMTAVGAAAAQFSWKSLTAGYETWAITGYPLLVGTAQSVMWVVLGLLAAPLTKQQKSAERPASPSEVLQARLKSEIQNIVQNIGSGLIILDRQGLISRINGEAARILGLQIDTVMGRPLPTVLGAGAREFSAIIQKVLEGTPAVARGELTIKRRNIEVPVGISAHPLDAEASGVSGVIAIFKDLTEINKMREQVRESDRLAGVGELAASIAHEIRNPLASIRGSVEILHEELSLAGYQAQLLELILKESSRVNTIINDFLAFARLRPLDPQLVSCADFMEDVALQIRQHVAVHGDKVTVSHKVTPHNLTLFADSEQMTQLILNLAINACEAMEYDGKLTLTLTQSTDSRYCELKVADTGPGVEDKVRSDLFKPFVTTKTTGTGLGLPMVARIAHAHHGHVSVKNSRDGGAVFSVKMMVSDAPSCQTGHNPVASTCVCMTEETLVP